MKKLIFAALAFAASTSGAADVRPLKGSQDAAGQVVAEYLQSYYKAPKNVAAPLTVLAKTVDSLTVQTHFRDKICTMKLIKNDGANQFGWVVDQHQCATLSH